MPRIPKDLKSKLPPGLSPDLQADFVAAIKTYATVAPWRELLSMIARYDDEERAEATAMLKNNKSLDVQGSKFAIKLIEGNLAHSILECIEVYDRQPW